MWTVTLIPSFEMSISRLDAVGVSTSISGIYRYINNAGEVVYIGKGYVKSRLSDKKREDWNFDTVEYSVISEEKEALSWERYYLDRFKYDNSGALPFYNRVNGHS
jgi:excinuclease UvrABC nuclease subunit